MVCVYIYIYKILFLIINTFCDVYDKSAIKVCIVKLNYKEFSLKLKNMERWPKKAYLYMSLPLDVNGWTSNYVPKLATKEKSSKKKYNRWTYWSLIYYSRWENPIYIKVKIHTESEAHGDSVSGLYNNQTKIFLKGEYLFIYYCVEHDRKGDLVYEAFKEE